ncbi:transposase [Enhygromyxa salina]|uniref:transposase n=1 Tax=Enhygromyxa salina TaxID=215803 RepID=UPI0015E5DCB1|nr:transposase [Enhygromyxa salina]
MHHGLLVDPQNINLCNDRKLIGKTHSDQGLIEAMGISYYHPMPNPIWGHLPCTLQVGDTCAPDDCSFPWPPPLPKPTSEQVAEVARWTHEAIARVLARHGRSLDGFDDVVDVLADEQPALASCYGASVGDRQLLGASPGEQTRKLVDPVCELDSPDEALADCGGVNIHVGPVIDGRDRKRLERLCRYMARPPVCQERLAVTESGQVVVRFENAWRNGAHAVVLDPLDFVARLVALIPAPHFNMVRYHGVLAARAASRSDVVPGVAPEQPEPTQLRLAYDGEATPVEVEVEVELKPASRHPWAWLLARVFAVDVMTCSRCGGRMRLVEIAD